MIGHNIPPCFIAWQERGTTKVWNVLENNAGAEEATSLVRYNRDWFAKEGEGENTAFLRWLAQSNQGAICSTETQR